MTRLRCYLAGTLTVSVLLSCRRAPAVSPAPADPNQVVATYDGGQFTRGEIAADLEQRLARESVPPTPETRQAALRALLARRVRIELLHRDALADGLPERPDLKLRLLAIEESLLAEDWLARHTGKGVGATPAQVEAEVARRAQPSEELRRFSNIFLRAPESDPAARKAARLRMERIRQELTEGQSFEELARAHSDSITARGGGQVEWTARGPLHPAAAAVVFSLSEGQMSQPLETDSGIHLFRLDGVRRGGQPDLAALRQEVSRALNQEALLAAIDAERTRVFDESGVRIDAKSLDRPPTPGARVTLGALVLSRRDFDSLREASAHTRALSPADFARLLLVNRLLADRRRAEGVDPVLTKRLENARKAEIVSVRRQELVAAVPREVTPAAEAEFHAKNREQAPFLKEYLLDVLFFKQEAPTAVEVYGEGERVSQRLRDGESLDRILETDGRRPGVVVRRRLVGCDMESLRRENHLIAREVGALPIGQVSRPLYLEKQRVSFGQRSPLIDGSGLLFVRVAEVRPFPLARVRERIREAIKIQKDNARIEEIQRQLNERGALKILVLDL
ncbi:MAG TPA: peptidylprolyl isomerase [Vicinamibacteria bacterium]|nr:peptidylprolyl isomerase [Vicinamibacteria bacterium]